MSQVKRYDCTMDYDIILPYMEQCSDGDYVEHDDYDALQKLNAELLEALEYALPYLEACVPSPRNGINPDCSVDVNCVDRARTAIAKTRSAQ